MAQEMKSLDVTDSPELLRLAREVAETGVGRVLRTADGDLAVLKPAPKPARRKRGPRKTGLLTKDDSFYKLIGIASSGTESDASERKHEILAQAYLPRE
jgi:hypothetical protein